MVSLKGSSLDDTLYINQLLVNKMETWTVSEVLLRCSRDSPRIQCLLLSRPGKDESCPKEITVRSDLYKSNRTGSKRVLKGRQTPEKMG